MTENRDLLFFESCHTSWCFDIGKLKFKRIPRPQTRQASATDFAAAQWEEYFDLIFDSGSDEFTVVLNRSETKLLRSWRHSENCAHCFGGASSYETEEISLGQLRDLLDSQD
ncbi:MAG: hypothetical protein EPN30_07435 [Actinomycetota bacterium]|nr:MAG: hypothetical protein EPN30_07435 [Actinomycetota bacterium]